MKISELIEEHESQCTPYKAKRKKRVHPVYYRCCRERLKKGWCRFAPENWQVFRKYATAENAEKAFKAITRNGKMSGFWEFSLTGTEE